MKNHTPSVHPRWRSCISSREESASGKLRAFGAFVATGALVAAVLVPLAVTPPAPAHADSGAFDEISVAGALRSAPELYGYKIDTSAVQLHVQDITVVNPAYEKTDTLGYHKSILRNPTDRTQTFFTTADDVTTTATVTTQSEHSVDTSLKIGRSVTVGMDFKIAKAEQSYSVEVQVGYGFKNSKTWTDTRTTTMRVPSQPIQVPPRSVATVSQWVDQGTYSAELGVEGRIQGDVKLTRCGTTVSIPIGQLVSLKRDPGRGALFPSSISVEGDHLNLKSSAQWSTNKATHQMVDVAITSLDGAAASSLPPTVVPLDPEGAAESERSLSAPEGQAEHGAARSAEEPEIESMRQIIPCDGSVYGPRLTLANAAGTYDLPALPAGLMPVHVATAQMGVTPGQLAWGSYVIASDGRLYRNATVHGNGDTGWIAAPPYKVTAMAVSSQSPGTIIYTDGRTVWDYRDNAYPALPAGVRVAELAYPSFTEESAIPTVLSSDGTVYQFRNYAWVKLAGSSVTSIVASEQSPDLLYRAADGIHFQGADGKNVVLPPLPAGEEPMNLQGTAVDGRAVLFVHSTSGRVYTASADRNTLDFSTWSTQPQTNIVAFSLAASGGPIAIFSDGQKIYTTDGRELPASPSESPIARLQRGTTADGRVAVNWFIDMDGQAFFNIDGQPAWLPVRADLIRGIEVSRNHEAVILGRD
ncbi:ETX/MTX2 family pore-forming toxin [Microbacterium sp. ACRRU]|uniref:ETX/MTX2 family pore-forming toxin n=1 Tax=Microbacterium sp. ACRRU TaxID=2918204 RepID=UPI001EF52895|nr:ETX/MTX2 family pore-forming toxin [Microbacterium sp. ACRRU]MCG7416410.1 ETX/MTX2 family pore-forming toxin [Microbacterium sp. ACRRU]